MCSQVERAIFGNSCWQQVLLLRSRAEAVDRVGVAAILFVMRSGGAGGEIAVALALVVAQRADALHVAQHERLGARQILSWSMPRAASIFGSSSAACGPWRTSASRSAEDIRNSLGDLVEIGGIHLAHFLQLAPVLQPFAEDVDHEADDGIGLFPERSWHGSLGVLEWPKVRADRASVVALDQIGGM